MIVMTMQQIFIDYGTSFHSHLIIMLKVMHESQEGKVLENLNSENSLVPNIWQLKWTYSDLILNIIAGNDRLE